MGVGTARKSTIINYKNKPIKNGEKQNSVKLNEIKHKNKPSRHLKIKHH
jgi:hypothetical protein